MPAALAPERRRSSRRRRGCAAGRSPEHATKPASDARGRAVARCECSSAVWFVVSWLMVLASASAVRGCRHARQACSLVVCRDPGAGVLGVVDRVGDQLAHVLVLDPVEDLVPCSAGAHQSAPSAAWPGAATPTARGLPTGLGELVHRAAPRRERPQQPDPGRHRRASGTPRRPGRPARGRAGARLPDYLHAYAYVHTCREQMPNRAGWRTLSKGRRRPEGWTGQRRSATASSLRPGSRASGHTPSSLAGTPHCGSDRSGPDGSNPSEGSADSLRNGCRHADPNNRFAENWRRSSAKSVLPPSRGDRDLCRAGGLPLPGLNRCHQARGMERSWVVSGLENLVPTLRAIPS